MHVALDEVELSGDRVAVSRDGRVIGTGRWRGGSVVDGSAGVDWVSVERAVRHAAEARDQSTMASAFDARGVDVTQIDRMLAMSPRERLATLEAQCEALLRLMPDASPHRDI